MTDWRHRAACRDEDPDLFFSGSTRPRAIARAKAVCGRCPVSANCLQWALTTPDPPGGIWGGTTRIERTRLRRRATQPRRPTQRDVADAAGVTQGTVAAAFSKQRTVTPQTRAKIYAAADQIGYTYQAPDRPRAPRRRS